MALLVSALAVPARASADDAAECTTDALLLSHFGRAFEPATGWQRKEVRSPNTTSESCTTADSGCLGTILKVQFGCGPGIRSGTDGPGSYVPAG
jgi:hypothetical protein